MLSTKTDCRAPYADELTGQPTRSAVEEEDFQFDERPKGIVTSKSITSMIPTSLLVRRETAKCLCLNGIGYLCCSDYTEKSCTSSVSRKTKAI